MYMRFSCVCVNVLFSFHFFIEAIVIPFSLNASQFKRSHIPFHFIRTFHFAFHANSIQIQHANFLYIFNFRCTQRRLLCRPDYYYYYYCYAIESFLCPYTQCSVRSVYAQSKVHVMPMCLLAVNKHTRNRH